MDPNPLTPNCGQADSILEALCPDEHAPVELGENWRLDPPQGLYTDVVPWEGLDLNWEWTDYLAQDEGPLADASRGWHSAALGGGLILGENTPLEPTIDLQFDCLSHEALQPVQDTGYLQPSVEMGHVPFDPLMTGGTPRLDTVAFDTASSSQFSLGFEAAFNIQSPQPLEPCYDTSFPDVEAVTAPLQVTDPSVPPEPSCSSTGNESPAVIPWDKFVDTTLKELNVVMVEETFVQNRLAEPAPNRDPWPELLWDHPDQIIPCKYGSRKSDVERLRPMSIRNTAACFTHRRLDCLSLFRTRVRGSRKNALLTSACRDSVGPELEPVTVCRPCYELSDGKLWRQACKLRHSSGRPAHISWYNEQWYGTITSANQVLALSIKEILPLCTTHSSVRSWPLRAGEVLVPDFPDLQTISMRDKTGDLMAVGRAQALSWEVPTVLEPVGQFREIGQMPHAFSVKRVDKQGAEYRVTLHHLQTIYVTKRQLKTAGKNSSTTSHDGSTSQSPVSTECAVRVRGLGGKTREVYKMSIPPEERCPTHDTRACLLLVEPDATQRISAISAACFSSIPHGMQPVSSCKQCITELGESVPFRASRIEADSVKLWWRNDGWSRDRDDYSGAAAVVTDELFNPMCVSHSRSGRSSRKRKAED